LGKSTFPPFSHSGIFSFHFSSKNNAPPFSGQAFTDSVKILIFFYNLKVKRHIIIHSPHILPLPKKSKIEYTMYLMKQNKHILLILITITVAACTNNPSRFAEVRLSITGESTIPVSMIIYGPREPDWDGIFSVLESKARLYDHRIKGSPIDSLNTESRIQVPDEVYRVITLGRNVAEESNGAFDPTILPLTRLWNFDGAPHLPPGEVIHAALKKINYRKIILLENNTISIPHEFGFDLGGIAKGAIVDNVADHLVSMGYENFLIEAGGDILISGIKPGKKEWGVAITHPRDKNTFLGEISLGEEGKRIAVVTSGDYERFFKKNGKRYHHILDPRTGYPAKEMVSVTVTAPGCAEADAIATAVFVLGKEEGLMFLEEHEDVEGLIVYESEDTLKMAMTEKFSTLFKSRTAP
jgi:FAD:protein FMN transferase